MQLFRDSYQKVTAEYADKKAWLDPVNAKEYTYKEFDTYVRKLAAGLAAKGLRKGDAAAIALPHSIDYIAVMYACLLSGICYIPLSDTWPGERIRTIADDAGATAVLRDDFLEGIDAFSPIADFQEPNAEDTALVIYTSGSTGRPKGVIQNHIGLIKAINRYSVYMDFREGDIFGSNTPFYFVAAMQDVFSAFCHGIPTVLIPDAFRGDPENLADFIDREGITAAFIMPKVLIYFKKKGTSLRRVLAGSERVSQLFFDDFTLVNGYGMSESAGGVLGFVVDQKYDNTPIGRPIGDEKIHILDENGREADEGELCIAGDVASGYHNLPELTAETFVKNPFEKEDGYPVLLRTGDLVKRLSSGDILFISRKDWMIKINGQRVEPGEIEAAIKSVDGIRDACVKDFSRPDGQIYITAYYVTKDGQDQEEERIKAQIAKKLPSYMIPSYYIRLDSLPVNANGKLDRKALKSPKLSDYSSEYAAPETKEQKAICDAFAQILSVKQVGIDDDFFSLGGDSIKACVLQNKLESFGIKKSSVFEAHTPRALAECITANPAGDESLSAYAKTHNKAKKEYPLTESMLSVYFDSKNPGRATVYNNVVGLFLPKECNKDDTKERLIRAVQTVLDSYPVLKCHVSEKVGWPMLEYDEHAAIPVEVIPTEETDRAVIAKEFIRPFDLARGPLARAAVYENPLGLFLIIDVHHIVSDGTSVSIMLDNISRAAEGRPLRKEQVTNLTLMDYEKEKLDAVKTEDNAFYRDMLDGLDGDTEIYADDMPELAAYTGKLGVYEGNLSEPDGACISRIDSVTRSRSVTESTVFFAAYSYLLRLLSGQKKVLVFAGENGRNDPLLSDTFGMMVHNIPVLMNVDEEKSCGEFLKTTQEHFFHCVSHDAAAFSELLSEYHIHPKYIFVYQGEMLSGVQLDGRYIPLEFYKAEDVMNDLTLHVLKQPGGDYVLRFEYDASLYCRDTVERFARLYSRIVSGLLSDSALSEIPLVGAEDIAEQEVHNATGRDYEIADIVTLFRKAVSGYPDHDAVYFKGQTLSYAQADQISDRIAAFLHSRGIGRGNVVSILIPRSVFMVTASLGVLKTGAAYQPLDPSYPDERLAFMMQDAGAAYLIADENLLAKVPGYKGPVLLTKEIDNLPDGSLADVEGPDPDSLFILLYTSGSTGTPKGVKLLHRNLANFCGWYREFYELEPSSRVSAYASYGFDADMMDLYPALTTGACTCIVEEEIRLDLLAAEKWFNENGITHCFMTTQVARQFYSTANVPGLKYLTAGGEKLVPIAPADSGTVLYNGYGPTECTIFTTIKRVDRLYDRIPIGKPLANCRLYVCDEYGRQLPALVPGELLICGAGVGDGYLNRPDLTEKVFIKNPYTDEPGYERAYRSGDVVRLLANGDIDYIGRNDGQVKIRGFRVELSEIEAVIREYPAVRDATVQAFDNENGSGKYVAAYIVVKEHENVPQGALEAFIRQRKPPYMVPSVIMELDSIPLNQNQKVDKRKLPKPERKPEGAENHADHEMTVLEQELFEICCKVIGNSNFGVYTPLVDAGLTSITTIQLMVEIDRKYGYSPNANEFLQGFRILDIENALVSNWRDHGVKSAEPDSPAQEDGILPAKAPLSQTQLGIYLDCRMDEASDKYNIPVLLKVSKAADAHRLADAIQKAVDVHPSMKCSIEPDESGSANMIAHADLKCEVVIEESNLSDEEIEEKIAKEPVRFDLSQAPLFRFRIIKNQESTYLFMVFHHILMDGTSLAVLMDDIERAYQHEDVAAESYNLLQLAEDEKEKRGSGALSKAKEVYDRIFQGVSLSSLPDPEKDSEETAGKAGAFEWAISEVSPEEVCAFCKDNQFTENAFFTTAFAWLLAKLSGNEEALFAAIYNGRTRPETLRIMGMLVKTYPVYVNFEKGGNTKDTIREVQKLIQELTANDIYSFAEAARDYDVNADILFAYQGDNFTGFTVAGEPALEIPQPFEDAKEALSVDVWKKDTGYTVVMEYRVDLYRSKQIEWMCDLYGMIVRGLLKEESLTDIPLLSDGARKYLETVNDTDVNTAFRPVSRMLEEWAEKTPEHPAVITPSRKTTYRELNESANRISHALFDGGARGHIVSLMLPRSEQVYMVRQGILKAGGAFLSITPDYPDERVRIMAEESGSVILVVNEEILRERGEFLGTIGCRVVTVESLLKDERTENLELTAEKDDLAYCIFTSGSTGKPKGVMLTQGNLFNFLDANPKNPEILGYVERTSVSLALAAITFDVSIMEEFIPLTHGMTVCMTTEEEIHNPAALSRFMLEHGVDMVSCTPSFLSNCIGLSVMKDALKYVASYDFGAEAFPAALYDKIIAINPDAYIMNGYGPTEATISCTMDQVTDPSLITIGRPASNVRAYVLDGNGHILPPLVPGELIISGEGVGKGYVGRPDLTEEKFFTLEGRPAYRTGDVAAWTSDAKLRFHGRADNQVKLRGLRVELGEIENAINAVEGVFTSIVIMAGEENNRFLAGYFTASREISPDELKAEISKTLTPYMVPGVLMQLPEMPLTQNGKIDKKKLPKVEFVPAAAEYSAPENDVERDFCAWFAEVLNMEKVSADGNFFELGGTSLSASVIAMKAADKGYNIVYADVFKSQTPRLLAALVNNDEASEEEAPEITEIRSFDYSKLPLDANTEDRLQEIHKGETGNILLTGATGFLGIHVLHEYLTTRTGDIYCLLRGDAPDHRLKQLYFYYFDEDLNPYFTEGRITVINGDITDTDSLEKAKEYPFDTLINCAALVKHFVKDDSLERINVQGVRNLIALCKEKGKRLIQTSTVSVAGEGMDGTPPRDFRLKENVLYRGQLLDNAYTLSKFKAEKAVLEAVSEGLDGKIMRLGNLMGRHSDGEFQVNYSSNAFIRTLASYKAIGAIPYSILNAVTDFSEIDMTAKAILLLAGTPKEFTVFHPVNNHVVTYADIVYSMREYGFTVESVEDSEFAVRMKNAGNASSALSAYNTRDGAERRYIIDQNCDFTTNALYRLDFKWPVSGEKYIIMMIKALDELTMFEE